MPITLLFGLTLVIALLLGKLFEKAGIPQVVAYILFGVFTGESFLSFYGKDLLDSLIPLSSFALALIGFMVGGELKYSIFKKYGSQFFTILFSEGLTAMLLVSLFCTAITGNLALGVLLGALSSATAPAATVDVLWEYRSRGPLTTTVLAIVALDDGLALILYGFALALADVLLTGEGLSLNILLWKPLLEIGGSMLLGLTFGALLDITFKFIKKAENRLILNLGTIILCSGIALKADLSLILSSMSIGLYLTNIHPHRNETSFELIKSFAPPIYVLFFVLVGARLQIDLLPKMGIIGVLYVIGRTAGKWIGAYFGAKFSGAPDSVRRYLGFALFSQAGVAIGLALDIYQHFQNYGETGQIVGNTIINVIAATTFIVQVIGPPSVKYAITKAGEVGKA